MKCNLCGLEWTVPPYTCPQCHGSQKRRGLPVWAWIIIGVAVVPLVLFLLSLLIFSFVYFRRVPPADVDNPAIATETQPNYGDPQAMPATTAPAPPEGNITDTAPILTPTPIPSTPTHTAPPTSSPAPVVSPATSPLIPPADQPANTPPVVPLSATKPEAVFLADPAFATFAMSSDAELLPRAYDLTMLGDRFKLTYQQAVADCLACGRGNGESRQTALRNVEEKVGTSYYNESLRSINQAFTNWKEHNIKR